MKKQNLTYEAPVVDVVHLKFRNSVMQTSPNVVNTEGYDGDEDELVGQ